MTNEIEKKTPPRKFTIVKLVLLIIFTVFLFFFYNTLISFGSPHLLALLIMLFLFLLFLGLLYKSKDYLSVLKRKKYENLQSGEREEYLKEFEKRQIRRVDKIKLDTKYRKPIIQKCSNCKMLLPHFAKKCPNCGEILTS